MNERFAYLVEKYLENDLFGDEVAEFEKYLTDPECAEYLKEAEQIEKLMMEGLRELVSAAEKKEILKTFPDGVPKEIIEDSDDEEIVPDERFREVLDEAHSLMIRRRRKIRVLSYVSAAAVAMVCLLFFFIPKAKRMAPAPTLVNVFEAYYRPFEFIVIRSEPDPKNIYERAENAYIGYNFKVSEYLCRTLVDSGLSDHNVFFLYGLSLMALDSMRPAIQQFNTVMAMPYLTDGYITAYSPWYTSLCYVYLGKKDSALLELDKIRGAEIMFLDSALVESLYGDIERARILVEDSIQTVAKHLR